MRKKTKKDKRRILLSFLVCCSLGISFCFSLFNYTSRIINNYQIEKQLTEQYNILLDKEVVLKEEIVKLEDPDYVARYAREKYLYSKDGEIIFKIVK